jgi:hypothetical protein
VLVTTRTSRPGADTAALEALGPLFFPCERVTYPPGLMYFPCTSFIYRQVVQQGVRADRQLLLSAAEPIR